MTEDKASPIAVWVAAHILPHESSVRGWLRRARASPDDIDDVIQEAYARLAALESVANIERPEAYFFSIVRNLLLRRLRRAKVVQIESVAEIESYVDDHVMTPERETAGRMQYARVRALIAALPVRCRQIVELRKIDGPSQREIAQRLGISESVVENQIHRGIRIVLQTLREQDAVIGTMLDTEPARRGEGL